MAEMLVVKSKIRDVAQGMNVSGDFADALNEKVHQLIMAAVKRSKDNDRKTIQPRDL